MHWKTLRSYRCIIQTMGGFCLVWGLCCAQVRGQRALPVDFEKPPFRYSDTKGNNRVTQLIADIASGKVELKYNQTRGYLESLLEELEISQASQVLVFSKTSLQVRYISRSNPRAIYFNDDTYVGCEKNEKGHPNF